MEAPAEAFAAEMKFEGKLLQRPAVAEDVLRNVPSALCEMEEGLVDVSQILPWQKNIVAPSRVPSEDLSEPSDSLQLEFLYGFTADISRQVGRGRWRVGRRAGRGRIAWHGMVCHGMPWYGCSVMWKGAVLYARKVKVMMLVCVCAVGDVFCGGRAALLQRGGRCEHGPEAALAAVLPAAPRHRDGDGREQGGRSGGDRRPGRAAVHPRVEQQQPADRGGAGRLPPQSHRAPQVLLRRRSLGQRRSEPSSHIISYYGHAMQPA